MGAFPITVYAKELDVRKTTSFVAAGQFQPSGIWDEYDTEDSREVLADYLRRSRDRIVEIQNSSRQHLYGIAFRRDYTLDRWNPAYDDCTPFDVVPPYRSGKLPFSRLNTVGREYRTWLINPTILLPRLAADLRRRAVRFRRREFESKGDFWELRQNIIVNCTGYGARALMNDDNVIAETWAPGCPQKDTPQTVLFLQWRLLESEDHVRVLSSHRYCCWRDSTERKRLRRHSGT